MSIVQKEMQKDDPRRFVIIHARGLTPQEMESLSDMGKTLKWSPKMTNISIADLQFDYLCVRLGKESRDFVMSNLHHADKDPDIHTIGVHDVEEQWVTATGCEVMIKRVPESIPEHMKRIFNDGLLQGHIKLPKSTNPVVRFFKRFFAMLLTLVGCSTKKYVETKKMLNL